MVIFHHSDLKIGEFVYFHILLTLFRAHYQNLMLQLAQREEVSLITNNHVLRIP